MEKKKFSDLVSTEKSKVHELIAFRKANKEWLRKSMAIAVSVLKQMREKKITQVELARQMGVSPQYVNKMLKGGENLTLETITKLEAILQVSLITVPVDQTKVDTYKLHADQGLSLSIVECPDESNKKQV